MALTFTESLWALKKNSLTSRQSYLDVRAIWEAQTYSPVSIFDNIITLLLSLNGIILESDQICEGFGAGFGDGGGRVVIYKLNTVQLNK